MLLTQLAFANKKETNWKENYNPKSKDPYGYFLFRQMVNELVDSNFEVKSNASSDKVFSLFNNYEKPSLTIFTSNYLDFSDDENAQMLSYVHSGGNVFLNSRSLGENLSKALNIQTSNSMFNLIDDKLNDTNFIQSNFNNKKDSFTFIGRKISTEIEHDFTKNNIDYQYYEVDTLAMVNSAAVCLLFRIGKGTIIVNVAPSIFSNYFLLQKNNRKLGEQILSHIPDNIKKVDWIKIGTRRASESESNPTNNLLKGLWKYPMWRAALLLTIFGLVLFLIVNGKRRSRIIPEIKPKRNTYIDFVETIGHLYYNNKDNKNLSDKMIINFMEQIRSKYNISTHLIDGEFVKKFALKSNISIEEADQLFRDIGAVRASVEVTDQTIVNLYNLFKKYKEKF